MYFYTISPPVNSFQACLLGLTMLDLVRKEPVSGFASCTSHCNAACVRRGLNLLGSIIIRMALCKVWLHLCQTVFGERCILSVEEREVSKTLVDDECCILWLLAMPFQSNRSSYGCEASVSALNAFLPYPR